MSKGLKQIQTNVPISDSTVRGTLPTVTVGESYPAGPISRLQDYSMLFKTRVTSMVVLTAWAGAFLAASAAHSLTFWIFPKILLGIGLVSAGAAAINEVMEWQTDARMSRTKDRPVPAGRMSVKHATIVGTAAIVLGCLYLGYATNLLTGLLAAGTAAAYCFIYTPLKTITPASTFIGAFPGAMPPLLGWTAVTGQVSWDAVSLFAILFFWQFPHFLSIAWLYREDYEKGRIRMRPVIDPSGKLTITEILFYGTALLPISLLPYFLGIGGKIYFAGAVIFGVAYLAFGVRLALLKLPPTAATTKKQARQLLQASITYLPLLMLVLILDRVSR